MKEIATLFLTTALLAHTFGATANEATASDDVLIKLDGSLNDYWIVEKKFAPKYPSLALKRNQEGCATVGYFIEADGSTSGHWVIASHPKDLFDRSAIKANKKFAYTPGVLNSQLQPVVTINTFTYKLARGGIKPGEKEQQALSNLCKKPAVEAIEKKYGKSR